MYTVAFPYLWVVSPLLSMCFVFIFYFKACLCSCDFWDDCVSYWLCMLKLNVFSRSIKQLHGEEPNKNKNKRGITNEQGSFGLEQTKVACDSNILFSHKCKDISCPPTSHYPPPMFLLFWIILLHKQIKQHLYIHHYLGYLSLLRISLHPPQNVKNKN